jgi:hypothetical protein
MNMHCVVVTVEHAKFAFPLSSWTQWRRYGKISWFWLKPMHNFGETEQDTLSVPYYARKSTNKNAFNFHNNWVLFFQPSYIVAYSC